VSEADQNNPRGPADDGPPADRPTDPSGIPNNIPDGLPPELVPQPASPGSRAEPPSTATNRSASVQLRGGAAPGRSETRGGMDPANRSLTDALKISYAILQLGMILLAVLFIFSGFRTVQENERGIRVLFGDPTDRSLEPGGHLTWPHPLGEMVAVDVGTVTVPIDLPFFVRPRRSGDGQDDFDFAPDRLPMPRSLNPAQHGSLITADGAIAHTRWQVIYRRAEHYEFAENIHPESERDIVTMAVQRGVVHAVATTTIDDLLKQSAGENANVARAARRLAQSTLDEVNSGLRIDNLYLVDKIPPTALIQDFNAVANAESEAGQRRERAEQTRRTLLNGVAGPAAETIVEAIEQYELSLAASSQQEQDASLQAVFDLLESGVLDDEGDLLQPVSGWVASTMDQARVQSDMAIRSAESQALLFEANLEQFEANPRLMVSRHWTEAFGAFLSRPEVEIWRTPSGSTQRIELVINRIPEFVESQNKAIKERQAAEAFQAREESMSEFRRQQRLQRQRERENQGG
jgi:regulator of protease activity HflC (stomatin/prohibitin superfamily)